MFYIPILISIVCFSVASYYDLRYTEFPDALPYTTIILILGVKFIYAVIFSFWEQLFLSILFGIFFLLIGFALYVTKQWGDGDMWLLSILGLVFSDNMGFTKPVFLVILINFFFVSFFYLVSYALIVGSRNKVVRKDFISSIRKKRTLIVSTFMLLLSLPLLLMLYISMKSIYFNIFPLFLLPFLYLFASIFVEFARSVEKKVFRKRISVKKLSKSHVIENGFWRGLKKEEIEKIKKEKKYVYVKEGVRFAPVFLITEILTILGFSFF